MVTPADVYHIQKIESLIKEKIKNIKLPAGIEVEPTSFAESQEMARAIDIQKHRENPDYMGAFHERKKKR